MGPQTARTVVILVTLSSATASGRSIVRLQKDRADLASRSRCVSNEMNRASVALHARFRVPSKSLSVLLACRPASFASSFFSFSRGTTCPTHPRLVSIGREKSLTRTLLAPRLTFPRAKFLAATLLANLFKAALRASGVFDKIVSGSWTCSARFDGACSGMYQRVLRKREKGRLQSGNFELECNCGKTIVILAK